MSKTKRRTQRKHKKDTQAEISSGPRVPWASGALAARMPSLAQQHIVVSVHLAIELIRHSEAAAGCVRTVLSRSSDTRSSQQDGIAAGARGP